MKKLLSTAAIAILFAVSGAQAAEVLTNESLDTVAAGATQSGSITNPGTGLWVWAFSGNGSAVASLTGTATATPGLASAQICPTACTVSFTHTF